MFFLTILASFITLKTSFITSDRGPFPCSEVNCFHRHKHGHFSTNCPQKKKNKKARGSATVEAFSSQFDLEFSLIACMVSSALGSVWYLDSGASFHMMGDKEIFSDLEEKDLQMHIEMDDDG